MIRGEISGWKDRDIISFVLAIMKSIGSLFKFAI